MVTAAKKSKVSRGASVKKLAGKAGKSKSAAKKNLLKSPVFIKSETKGDFLEQLSTLKQIKAKAKIPTEKPLSLRNNLSLALLSPYRLPIDADKLAMQTARVAGMAFVVIGAILTVLHLPVVSEELAANFDNSQSAAALLAYEPNDGSCAGCEPSNINTAYQFRATISVTPDYDTKKYLTKINTSEGLKVEVKLVDSSGKIQTIGYGEKQDSTSGSWLHTWDATNAAPGTYKIYGSVTNNNGTYSTSKVTITVMETPAVTPPAATTPAPSPLPTPTPETIAEETTTTEETSSTVDTNTTSDPSATTADDSDEFSLTVSNANDLSELAEVEVKVTDASAVEIFVLPKNASTPRYLGLASIKARNEWRYLWNTANTPNGDYRLFAVAKLGSGKTNSPYKSVQVNNAPVKNEISTADTVAPVKTETAVREVSLDTAVTPPPPTNPPPLYYETVQKIAAVEEEFKGQEFVREEENAISLLPPPEDSSLIEAELEELLSEYEVDIENEIERLKVALRSGDQEQVDLINKRIEELRNKIIKNSFEVGDDSLLSFVGQRLDEEFSGLTEKVAYTEKIIKERVGEEVFKDSDADGISDYDEAVLYETDPASADSDSDGFTDGAEILNGYDPKDASPEAAVVFESPQNKGLERKDLLAVSSIENTKRVENAGENNQAESTPAALIKGKGLPNSFVTLYIFSTPVVVTVKTDAEGNWEYTFDKELENGEHEVYVGITDNAGSIVAKSEPLRFVKTAEAFTPVAEAENTPVTFTQSDPGFLTQNMIMLVMSISVVIIGLILMLLGLHLKTSRRNGEHLVQEGFVAT